MTPQQPRELECTPGETWQTNPATLTGCTLKVVPFPPDPVQVGDVVFLTFRGLPVTAYVLALLDEQMLVEYEVGNHTALRLVPVSDPDSASFRHVSYHRCPRRWLAAIVAAGQTWLGAPRGHSDRVLSPAEMLAAQYPER